MEVVVISAYCPNIETQDKLRELVRKIKSFNYDIILVSHSIIPNDILESCDYHFYDKENKLLYGENYDFWWSYALSNHEVLDMKEKLFFTKDSYMLRQGNIVLPVLRLILFGLSIAKQLGYVYAHYIEYDCDITNKDFFRNNTKLLKKGYENLSYRWKIDTGKYEGDWEIVMCYLAFNLNYYTWKNLHYNEETTLKEFQLYAPTFENFFKPKYLDFNNGEPRKCFIKELKHTVANHHTTEKDDIAYEDGLIRDIIKNGKEKEEKQYLVDILPLRIENNFFFIKISDWVGLEDRNKKYEFTVNDKVFKGKFDKHFECNIFGTGYEFDQIYYIKSTINDKVIYEYNLDNEEGRRIFNARNFMIDS